jgi:hypothetical protein
MLLLEIEVLMLTLVVGEEVKRCDVYKCSVAPWTGTWGQVDVAHVACAADELAALFRVSCMTCSEAESCLQAR